MRLLRPLRPFRPGRIRRPLRLGRRPRGRPGSPWPWSRRPRPLGALCALGLVLAGLISLTGPGPTAALSAPQLMARASSEVLRLEAAAQSAKAGYEQGRSVERAQRLRSARLAVMLRDRRAAAAALREETAALARERRGLRALSADVRVPAWGGPWELLHRQAAVRQRADGLQRMTGETRRMSAKLAAEERVATAAWHALTQRTARLRGREQRAERRLETARGALRWMAAAASANGKCGALPRPAAAGSSAVSLAAGVGWTRPVASYELSAGFGGSGSRWAKGHTGQDFAVPVGTPVRAIGAGTVVSVGCGDAFGISAVIRHPGGWYTQYAHLSALYVARGTRVRAGDWIGLSGSTGNSTGPHLHFEVRKGPEYGTAVDPVAWLKARGVRL
ncbi:M23 family metallopeptidase [Streptomyces varsoviensis]|uniref:M23 family metallopeptidase n=1 Tax=Streptomyces varsoviensis TaxID=67373 RepID=UPI0012FF1EC9|nr:M23 family metallopeptidase [Streptomyces varsoviensis]